MADGVAHADGSGACLIQATQAFDGSGDFAAVTRLPRTERCATRAGSTWQHSAGAIVSGSGSYESVPGSRSYLFEPVARLETYRGVLVS
jgi:hypothetical protein